MNKRILKCDENFVDKGEQKKNAVGVVVCLCVRLAIANYFQNVIHLRVDCVTALTTPNRSNNQEQCNIRAWAWSPICHF